MPVTMPSAISGASLNSKTELVRYAREPRKSGDCSCRILSTFRASSKTELPQIIKRLCSGYMNQPMLRLSMPPGSACSRACLIIGQEEVRYSSVKIMRQSLFGLAWPGANGSER